MLRSQSALEVKQHKGRAVGFINRRWRRFASTGKSPSACGAKKVLGIIANGDGGDAGRRRAIMVTAESISHQSYRRLLSAPVNMCWKNMSEPVTVLDLCNQLHVQSPHATKRVSRYFGIEPKRVG